MKILYDINRLPSRYIRPLSLNSIADAAHRPKLTPPASFRNLYRGCRRTIRGNSRSDSWNAASPPLKKLSMEEAPCPSSWRLQTRISLLSYPD